MKSISLTSSIFTFTLITTTFSPAYAVVDQENLIDPNYLSIQPNSDERWQQEVIVGVTGRLDAIELFYKQDAPWLGETLKFTFTINRGEGWQTDADDYSRIVEASTNGILINVSSENLAFQQNERFVFGISRAAGSTLCCSLLATANNYYGGFWGEYSNSVHSLQADMAFRTYVSAVPEPSSWSLIIAGLLALNFKCRNQNPRNTAKVCY
jgi:hypothetical protein